MDAETHHDQSKSIEEHGHEDGFSIDWLSEDLLAEELIQTDDASAYPADSHDTKDSLPSWLEPRAALATNRPTTYQTDRHQAKDQLQLWQVLTPGVQKAHSDSGSFIDPDSHSLDDLVDRLVHPGCDSHEMNNLGTAIVMHADLMTKTSKLKVYSKMNGGMKHYSPGTTQAWLYTPKKRKRTNDDVDNATADSSSVLVVVYPDKAGPSDSRDGSRDIFHFGGRAHTFHSGNDFDVLIQHGSYKALGCV
jgi:hypothetical protein